MPKKYALVIGNTEYTDPDLAKLNAPGRDAEDFARVLQLAEMAAFDEVVTLVNENTSKLNEAIEDFFADKKSDDLLVFYFSGHGVRDDEGSLFLAVKNTRKTRLYATAITAEFIRKLMDKSRSTRQVIILDCCNSGAFPQGQTKGDAAMGMVGSLQGYGRVVLTATDKLQYAWEGDTLLETDRSLFTHFLVKGLEGAADRDDDGKITVDELYDYAFDKVREATPDQTPTKSATGQKGEIILREGIKKEVKPTPLPADLLSAAENTMPYVREAAVKQLENLLNGKNAGLALSAGKELQRIIADENTTYRVAQLAKQALENAGQVLTPAAEEEEEKRLAAQKAEEERIAHEKAETERKAKVEADRLAAQKAEEERIAREKAETERKAKVEVERLAAQKAEDERIAREKEERKKIERDAVEKEKREVIEKASREKAEKEAVEKAWLVAEKQALQKASKEKAEREAAEKITLTPQNRILEAAIQKQVIVDKPASLYVWIKQIGSKSIISVVKSDVDENEVLDENSVKSKGLEIEFPIENGVIEKAKVSLRLVAPEFSPPTQQKEIEVPVTGDSDVHAFLVTPKKIGELLLNIEVLKDKYSVVNRNLRTTAVEVATKETRSMVLMSFPIVVVVQPKIDIVNINGNVSDSVIISGDENAINNREHNTKEKLETERSREAATKATQAFLPKLKIPALILAVGVVGYFLWQGISSWIPTFSIGSTKISNIDGMTLVYVPAGEFTMGDDNGEKDERPAHKVYLDAFWIDQTEVTNKQYKVCVNAGACEPPSDTGNFNNSNYKQHPVVYVDWNMAKAYCNWAGGDLPTEAQWEKAARGTDGRIYPWGEAIDCDKANYQSSCVGDTASVGSYKSGKSPYGAYDMAGNVWEWVNDLYGEDYYQNSPSSNPGGPISGTYRVLRGGSWDNLISHAHSSLRLKFTADGNSYIVGFRCARSP